MCSWLVKSNSTSYCKFPRKSTTHCGQLLGCMVSHCVVVVLDALGVCLATMGPTLGVNFLSQVSCPLQRDLKHWADRIEDADMLDVE